MAENIKIVSLNVNGMKNPIKRKKIITKMKKAKAQVVYLQETHLSKQEHEKFRGFGYSFRHGSKRGVSIPIHNSVKFECTHKLSDKEGLLVKGALQDVMVTLVNVYIPPNSNTQFCENLLNKIIIETEECVGRGS